MHTNNSSNPWELIFHTQGRFYTEPMPVFEEIAQKFTQHACRHILDLGCGSGRM